MKMIIFDMNMNTYCPEGPRDMKMLGYCVAKNTMLRGITLSGEHPLDRVVIMKTFFSVARNSSSIETIALGYTNMAQRACICLYSFILGWP